MAEKKPFRVLIAGGGLAGLTLANALERGGVDFVLLERRDEIAPQVGASIGMLSNGCRILDQLGVYDEFCKHVEPIQWSADRDKNGWLLAPRSDFTRLNTARTGYGVFFGDRQALLQILFDGLKDKSKVLLNKNIADIKHSPGRVTAHCEDGTSYEGDILAGADGIYSKTRDMVWKFAAEQDPMAVEKDKQAITAEYQCLFGISNPVKGFDVGDADFVYDRDRTSLLTVSKGGRTYYFIFQRLERVIHGVENMPRYSRQEKEDFARAHANMTLRPGIPFSALWKSTTSSNLVVLEEATFQIWTWGRIACLGDSIHKMTPNTGYGGNAAIESAAALASAIKELLDTTPGSRPDESQIEACLELYQKARQKRAAAAVWISRQATRLQALRSPLHILFTKYCLPYLGDHLADTGSDMIIGAAAITYLPLPWRSAVGTMPYNPAQGTGLKERKLIRAALTLPFLILFFLAKKLMDPAPLIPVAAEVLRSGGKLPWGDISVSTNFFNLEWLDDLLAPLVIFFSPAVYGFDSVSPHAFLFLADFGVVLAIWLIESARRANAFTPAQLPFFFALASQFIGVGVISPLYYLLHYIASPIENFKASDMRLTRISYTKSILPAVLLVHYLPIYSAFYCASFPARIAWISLWQLFPVWLSLLASPLLSRLFADTTPHDRIHNAERDLPTIRATVGLLALHSAAAWVLTFLTTAGLSASAMLALMMPPATLYQGQADLVTLSGEFLRLDSAFLFGNTFLWLAYLFWDIKHAGMLRLSWVWIMLLAAVAVVGLGPGAAVGLGWLWREELLAKRRHRAAVTEKVAREWNRKLGVEWEEDGEKMVEGKKS
ncbi:FAD binding domain protein [Lasiosphaeria hispida]|uniref:FAD binding domain protein n=1 Tax=Lasiosphaeria hispida TaxID=260671 RepID=A0AAJ0HF34_9PEZI|nr:FAD binding domain protein [Lasiosphaeria hispida]